MRLCVGTDGVKGLLTDVVLDLTGVCLRRSGVDAQRHQEFRQRVVPVQHTLGDGHTAGRQGDESVLVHRDIAVFPQPFGGVGHAGLCHAQMLGHVDGTNISMLLLHHQHRL